MTQETNLTSENLYETAYCHHHLVNNILYVQYKENIAIHLEDAQLIVKNRLQSYKGLTYPVLVRSSKIKILDKEARKYFFSHGTKNISAMAIIETNPLEKVLSNVILDLSGPNIPCRLFLGEKAAIDWLNKFKAA